jgi:hypothetical protein
VRRGFVCLLIAVGLTHTVISTISGGVPQTVTAGTLPDVQEYAAILRRNIREADRSEYSPVGDPWKNPTIKIDFERTSIIFGNGSSRKETNLSDLAKDLASLPRSVWPLGRVVVFARDGRTFPLIGLTGAPAPRAASDPRLTETDIQAAAVLKILELLGLQIVGAPLN